jgi:hypothetical protein
MKTRHFTQSAVAGCAAAILLLGITPEVNSQPRQDSLLDVTRRVQQKQDMVAEQQAKTLARIAEIQKKADQTRIFAKRG